MDPQIAEGSGRALEFSRHYGVKAHSIQRAGISPTALPNISDCEAMIRQQNRVLDALTRIKEVIITQQNALAEQRSQEQGQRGAHGPDDDDLSAYGEKADGSGGFAGSDMKKRRGVCAVASFWFYFLLTLHREQHLPVDATAAIELKHRNGVGDLMELVLCAMLAGYVCISYPFDIASLQDQITPS